MGLGNSCRCLILCLYRAFQLSIPRCKDFVEIFAGAHAVSDGIISMGYVGTAIDKDTGGAAHDLLTWNGYLHAIINVLSIKRGGLLWLAPPCGNFVWMSRHSTKRSLAAPLGQGPKAAIANRLTSRTVFLIWLATSIGVLVIIEQPKSSILWEHPDVKRLFLALPHLYSAETEMGAFGANARKSLTLKGTAPWLPQLAGRCTAKDKRRIAASRGQCALTRRFVDKQGISRSRGNRNLTASAAYPAKFGERVGVEFAKFCSASGHSSDIEPPVTMNDFNGIARFELLHEDVFDDLWNKIQPMCND
jgi:hypothetical protein